MFANTSVVMSIIKQRVQRRPENAQNGPSVTYLYVRLRSSSSTSPKANSARGAEKGTSISSTFAPARVNMALLVGADMQACALILRCATAICHAHAQRLPGPCILAPPTELSFSQRRG